MDQTGSAARPKDATVLELMPANPAGRRLGVAMIALLLIGLAGFAALIVPNMDAAFGPTPSAHALNIIKTGFAALSAIVTMMAVALTVSGWRIVRSRQVPPPGALLWRPARIVRGLKARRLGLAYGAAGILCAALGIGLGATIWSMLGRVLEPRTISLPDGITILKQTSPPAQ